MLDAALQVVGDGGPRSLTTEAVARQMGGHVGSIYYRFPTKDHLIARLWIRCAAEGQRGMLQALNAPDLDSALESAALHYPRWSRSHLDQARVLAAYGREQLAPTWPTDLADELATVNETLARAIVDFTQRWYGDASSGHRRATTFALLDLPASAIRRYLLAGRPAPASIDPVILAAARAAMDAAT